MKKSNVKFNGIYSPQNYVGEVLGTYYFFQYKGSMIDEIHDFLLLNGYALRDYPLTEIDHIVENNLNVVLVDCSHYEGDDYINEYRWFEVPEDFEPETDKED